MVLTLSKNLLEEVVLTTSIAAIMLEVVYDRTNPILKKESIFAFTVYGEGVALSLYYLQQLSYHKIMVFSSQRRHAQA